MAMGSKKLFNRTEKKSRNKNANNEMQTSTKELMIFCFFNSFESKISKYGCSYKEGRKILKPEFKCK